MNEEIQPADCAGKDMPESDHRKSLIVLLTAILVTALVLIALVPERAAVWRKSSPDKAEGSSAHAGLSGNGDAPADPAGTGVTAEGTDPDGTALQPVEDGLLRVAWNYTQDDMDVAKNTSDYYLPLNVFDQLVSIVKDEDGTTRTEPSAAESWEVSRDGRVYSFRLRDDLYFSDGSKVTAEDVRFSFTRLLTVPDSVQTAYMDMVEGADEVLDGKTDVLEGIRVLSDREFTITLKEPFSGFINMLGSPACSILSKKYVTAAGDNYGRDPQYTVGSGAYFIRDWSKKHVTLEMNPYYKREPLSVRKADIRILSPTLIMEGFKEGEIDIMDISLVNRRQAEAYLEDRSDLERSIDVGTVNIRGLMLNEEVPPLNDVRVRRAIQLAIDRDAIVRSLLRADAELIDGIFPRGIDGFSEDNQGWLRYDPGEARRLLLEAGYEDGFTLEIAMESMANEEEQEIVHLISEDLGVIGINAINVIYDRDSYIYLRGRGELMAHFFKWSADYNDPDNFIYTFFGTEETARAHSCGYADREVQRRLKEARAILDKEERMAEYSALERKIVEDDAAFVPLFSTNHLFILGDRVSGFTPYWAGWGEIPFKDVELR